MEALYTLFMAVPGMECKMRFKIPFFYRRKWIAYMNPQKKGGIELVFIKGQLMGDAHGLLETRGRKMVSGVIIEKWTRNLEEPVNELLQEALILDESLSR